MRNIWLIARHEFLLVMRTRGFWISVLVAPMIGAIASLVPQWIESAQGARYYILIDQTGRYGASIEAERERGYQRELLEALSDYARRYVGRGGAFMELDFLKPIADIKDEDVAAFQARGLEAVIKILAPDLKEGAPAFQAPERRFIRIDAPPGIDPGGDPRVIGSALSPHLMGNQAVSGPAGSRPSLYALIIIPKGFVPGVAALGNSIQIWSTSVAETGLSSELRRIMRTLAQREAYLAQGIDPALVAKVQTLAIGYDSYNPASSGDAARSLTDQLIQFVPMMLSIVLWIITFIVGGILLTNTIEERSNKLIEVLLSSVTAEELMIGKLLGVGATGFLILAFWIGAGLAALFAFNGEAAMFGRELLKLLFSSYLIFAFLLYFLASYLIVTAVYLTIGSIANTIQDSQGYLVPVSVVMMMPVIMAFIIQSDPNGTVARVMSWVPFFTPFVMMLRLPANPPAFEVAGTGIVLFLFVVGLLFLVGRIFRANLLRSGQPPAWRELLRHVLPRS
ncbi:MAG: ABC transporter permease [Alphaproteobacteria bacterium]|nr:ABC transporter permease [Alphaproteobacteria bacterium]